MLCLFRHTVRWKSPFKSLAVRREPSITCRSLKPKICCNSPHNFDLAACAKAQGTEVRAGDIVLVRTGWIDKFLSWNVMGPADFSGREFGQPGLDVGSVSFLDDHDVAVVGCDNSAIEVLGREGDGFLSVHVELLVKRGIHLIEHLMLKEMADDRCYESLFICAPLPVVGAAGSPVNPVAIG